MPLLARTLLTPLTIEISAGAISRLGEVLADRRITGAGEVAVVLGNGIGGELDETVGRRTSARRHQAHPGRHA